MPDQKILIKKAGGAVEPFDIGKLRHSLEKSRASQETIEKVVDHVAQEVEEGMTTHQIYEHAFNLLHKIEAQTAVRYSLRRALLALGPTGFPFERFVAEIFKADGYQTLNDQIVKGACVEHEIDVVAWKTGAETKLIMSEAKFHHELGLKSDLKVVLYVKARYEDLGKVTFNYGGETMPLSEGLLVTNTKFTVTSIKYAECQKMKIIGWNYPLDGNLQDLVERARLHPLTVLHSLSEHDKKALLAQNIVLCTGLKENPSLLKNLGLAESNIEAVLDEVNHISE